MPEIDRRVAKCKLYGAPGHECFHFRGDIRDTATGNELFHVNEFLHAPFEFKFVSVAQCVVKGEVADKIRLVDPLKIAVKQIFLQVLFHKRYIQVNQNVIHKCGTEENKGKYNNQWIGAIGLFHGCIIGG